MNDAQTGAQARATATFAGGCFWCLEAAFAGLRGVSEVKSGYMGGHVARPGYEAVCGGATGHAEVTRLRFDADVITYAELLEVFFAIHDPTTPNRQGNDVGTQYRSAIFHHDAAQRAEAEACVARLAAQGTYAAPIVTEIVPAGEFWPAEDYHDDYYARHPNQPYCRFVVAPKIAKVRARFPERLKPAP
jgi:peptide-methionine (S)-S-oxide reductase